MVLGTNFLAACFELSIFRSITISKRTATASGPRQKEFFLSQFYFSSKNGEIPEGKPRHTFLANRGYNREIVYTQISKRYSLKYFHLNSGPESD